MNDQTQQLLARITDLEAQLYAIGAGGVRQSIQPPVQADTAQKPGAGIPASVPTGWKLVPMEPTAAMLDAAFDIEVVHTEYGVDAFVENTDEVYRAMLAAAPEAPAQQKPVAHLPCCGYTDTSALQWNPYNGAAQCHNCGQVYTAPRPTENLHCKSTQKRLATLWGYVKKEPDHFRDATKMVPVSQMLEALRTKYSDLIYESNQKMAVHFEEDIFTINEFLRRIQQEAAEKARQPLTDEKLYALYCEAMKGYYVSALHYWRETEAHKFARAIEAVVANQPTSQPLMDEQILSIVRVAPALDTAEAEWLHVARAVEVAHGITGGQQ